MKRRCRENGGAAKLEVQIDVPRTEAHELQAHPNGGSKAAAAVHSKDAPCRGHSASSACRS